MPSVHGIEARKPIDAMTDAEIRYLWDQVRRNDDPTRISGIVSGAVRPAGDRDKCISMLGRKVIERGLLMA